MGELSAKPGIYTNDNKLSCSDKLTDKYLAHSDNYPKTLQPIVYIATGKTRGKKMLTKTVDHTVKQKTIRKPVTYVGVGLHTGKAASICVKPAPENSGINFLRKDAKPDEGLIAARWYNVTNNNLSTEIGNEHGVTVCTVEHLLAALSGCGVDNALVEIVGPEVPIMDGSSEPFVQMIEKVGTKIQNADRYIIWVHKPIEYRDGDRYALLMPDITSRFTVQIDFDSAAIGRQVHSVELVNEAFRLNIASARTFGFAHHVEKLKNLGLIQGASLNNAILVDGDRIVNKEGLRYQDEFVRHKILDCYGDFGLVGAQVMGHYFAEKPGHDLNHKFVKFMFNQRDAWSYLPIEEFYQLMGRRNTGISKQEIEQEPVASTRVKEANFYRRGS